MQKKNKAFTLTELLVVVIVLGVLAAVAVPKFARVLETRKTTEAEEIFAAVRTEQENRCVFGKNYLTDKTQLSMLSGADNSGSYAYSLTGQGIVASSDKGYQLKMPSYKDGQICCEGAYCESLNKSYPSCSAISVSTDECAGETLPTWERFPCALNNRPVTNEPCNECGTRTRSVTCNTATGKWVTGSWSACSKTEEECSPTKTCDESAKPEASQSCNECGTRTRSVTCDTATGKWVTGSWSTCSKTEEECSPTKTCDESAKPAASQSCNECGTQRRSVTCDTNTGVWQSGDWGSCSVASSDECCTPGRVAADDYPHWEPDTCDGDDSKQYTCSFGETKTCYDKYSVTMGGGSSGGCSSDVRPSCPSSDYIIRCVDGEWKCQNPAYDNCPGGICNEYSGGSMANIPYTMIVVDKVTCCGVSAAYQGNASLQQK